MNYLTYVYITWKTHKGLTTYAIHCIQGSHSWNVLLKKSVHKHHRFMLDRTILLTMRYLYNNKSIPNSGIYIKTVYRTAPIHVAKIIVWNKKGQPVSKRTSYSQYIYNGTHTNKDYGIPADEARDGHGLIMSEIGKYLKLFNGGIHFKICDKDDLNKATADRFAKDNMPNTRPQTTRKHVSKRSRLIEVLTTAPKKRRFEMACRANDTTPSKVIRKYMKTYIKRTANELIN